MHTLSKTVRPRAALVRVWKRGFLILPFVTFGLLASAARAAEEEASTKSSKTEKNTRKKPAFKPAAPPEAAGPAATPADASELKTKEGEQILPPPLVPPDAPVPTDPSLVPELTTLPDPNLNPSVEGAPVSERKITRDRATPQSGAEREEGGGGGVAGESAETFTIPGFYGHAPAQYTTGKGRLALPQFRSSLSLGVGYDDNPQTQTQSSADSETGGSLFTSLNYAASFQKAHHREIFIWDGHAGGTLYSQNDPSYDVSLGFSYQRRFVLPFTLSANLGLTYSNQNQYGEQGYVRRRENESESAGSSGSLNAHANLVFGARWSPQFHTSTTIAADTALYGGTRDQNNGLNLSFGQAFNYRVDRYAFIADVRYQTSTYQNSDQNPGVRGGNSDSDTVYLLAGVEWRLGPLFVSTRFGESLRSYSGGGSSADPYGELAISFSPNVQNSFSLSARYGLETNAAGEGDSTTFRVGLSYNRVFTSRLNGSLSLNYTDSGGTIADSTTGSGSFGGERIFDATLAFNYKLTSRLSLSASGTCTRGSGGASNGLSDPDRNSVQLNAVYQF